MQKVFIQLCTRVPPLTLVTLKGVLAGIVALVSYGVLSWVVFLVLTPVYQKLSVNQMAAIAYAKTLAVSVCAFSIGWGLF